MPRIAQTPKSRFLKKVKKEEVGCWNWDSTYRNHNGYPMFYWGKIDGKEKNMKASRASYLIFRGDIGSGLHVCHSCDNRNCVNPDHLWLGTHQDNMDDRAQKGRTSSGAKRYNFVRTDSLIKNIKKMRESGFKIDDICESLNIKRSTYYRCAHSAGIKIRQGNY